MAKWYDSHFGYGLGMFLILGGIGTCTYLERKGQAEIEAVRGLEVRVEAREKVVVDERGGPVYPWRIVKDIDGNGTPDITKILTIGPPPAGYIAIRKPTEDEIRQYLGE